MKPEEKLKKLGKRPQRGQHFLKSQYVIEALVKAGEVDDHKTLEIGGGLGAITRELLKKTGELTVLETDKELANHLKKEYEASVKVEDVLEFDLDGFERCVSNIPFEISSEILEKLAGSGLQSSLIVQDELADKVVAEPGSPQYCELTVKMKYFGLPVKLRTVDSSNFYPEPEVDAAILKFYPNKRYSPNDGEFFFKTVKGLFTHKRKKLRNGLVDSRNILEIKKNRLKEIRDSLPHSDKRINDMEVKELVEVSDALQSELE